MSEEMKAMSLLAWGKEKHGEDGVEAFVGELLATMVAMARTMRENAEGDEEEEGAGFGWKLELADETAWDIEITRVAMRRFVE